MSSSDASTEGWTWWSIYSRSWPRKFAASACSSARIGEWPSTSSKKGPETGPGSTWPQRGRTQTIPTGCSSTVRCRVRTVNHTRLIGTARIRDSVQSPATSRSASAGPSAPAPREMSSLRFAVQERTQESARPPFLLRLVVRPFGDAAALGPDCAGRQTSAPADSSVEYRRRGARAWLPIQIPIFDNRLPVAQIPVRRRCRIGERRAPGANSDAATAGGRC